jgi:hypothetical protein
MVIWAAIKGFDSPCPAPVHAGFFTPAADDEEDNE